MRMKVIGAAIASAALIPAAAFAVDAGKVSVARGLQVSIIGGCHDCHTANYNETGGMIDPNAALKGIAIGWQGPWGTTYAKNLRLIAQPMTEDQWLTYAKTFKAMPPMPAYNVHAMDDSDLRSLYQYIKSLGAPGPAMPDALPPGVKPKTPFVVNAPPTLPTP
jgi:mono/diheme cytochrome c family protein